MKKYILLFILPFLFLNKVYAFETIPYQTEFVVSDSSCSSNLMNPTFIFHGRVVNNATTYGDRSANMASQLISITPSTNYTISLTYDIRIRGIWISFLSSANGPAFGTTSTYSNIHLPYTFSTPENANYLVLTIWFNGDYTDFSNIDVMLNEGNTSLEYVDYSTSCTPPSPPPPQPDSTYSSFITLYLDKISYLATGFTTNPYLLAMLGIIFSWIILELFLHILHLKGGYKK